MGIFENLGEYVYVADAETHELIYMNKKTLKSYGFQSHEEIIGLKCYEILQGNSLPYGMCNNEQLKPGFLRNGNITIRCCEENFISRTHW